MQSRIDRWLVRFIGGLLTLGVLVAITPSLGNPRTTATRRRIDLGKTRPNSLYALTVSVKNPAQMQGTDSVLVTVADAQGPIAEKWLHGADLDFYMTLRPHAAAHAIANLSAPSGAKLPKITAVLRPIPSRREANSAPSDDKPAIIAAQPNNTWQTAQPFEFGQTIFGSADERPYVPAPA
jgi:hypothetical protein